MSVTYDAASTSPNASRQLGRLAAKQHGVFSRAQVLAIGLNRRTVDRRLLSGQWLRVYAGVYRLAGSPRTWRQSLLAACLACSAVVSHLAAAALWGFPGFSQSGIELSAARGRRRLQGVRLHRPKALPAADVTTTDGVPVTTPARTLIDISASVSAEALEEALDDALRRNLATVRQMRWRLEQLGSAGRRGAKTLGRLLDERAGALSVPQSVFETRLLRELRRARLPKPVLQYEVRTHRGPAVLDFAYPEQKVAIEADGFRWHSSRQQLDHDRARANALTVLGWIIIRVTWSQLRERPDEVIDTIRSILGSKPDIAYAAHIPPGGIMGEP